MRTAAAPWRSVATGAALFMLFPIAWLIRPFVLESNIPICFFRAATGHQCPLCGLTHAMVCATHGDFEGASHFHRFWWFAALVIVALGSRFIWKGLRTRRISSPA